MLTPPTTWPSPPPARLSAVSSTLRVTILLAFVAIGAALAPLILLENPSTVCCCGAPMATITSADALSVDLPGPPERKGTVLARSRPTDGGALSWAGLLAVRPLPLHVDALMVSACAAP